jgi:hypothetical protein
MRESVHPVPPTRPQQVYRPGPPFNPVRPVAPQFTPAAPPPVAPPQHRAPRQGNRRELTIAGAVIGGISLVVAIIVIGVQSSSNSSSSQPAQSGPTCYSTVTDPQGHAVTVATLGNVNCTSVAQFLGDQFPTYQVTPNAPKGPGNAVCQGMLGGAYPATVIDPTGNSEDTECLYLGFSAAP